MNSVSQGSFMVEMRLTVGLGWTKWVQAKPVVIEAITIQEYRMTIGELYKRIRYFFIGFPATPRDGAAVEIVGLCAAVLKKLSETKEYEHHYVENLTSEFSIF